MDANLTAIPGEGRCTARNAALFSGPIVRRAALDALIKLDPRRLVRNPVIFVTEVVAILVTILAAHAVVLGQPWSFQAGIALWLWLTVLFATFAEAVAEGRGRARAESLRRTRTDARAKLLLRGDDRTLWQPRAATELRVGDLVLASARKASGRFAAAVTHWPTLHDVPAPSRLG
jgi:K+-transporting ATPase ATPase B chain